MGGVQWGGNWVGGNTSVTSGTWTFITVVRSGGTDTFYVNGVADGSTATNMNGKEQGTQDIRIGGQFDPGDGVTAFNGQISGSYLFGMPDWHASRP